MDASRWDRMKGLYDSALELPVAQRPAYLAQACGDDSALRQEVESLLAHADTEDSPIDRPAWEGAASLIGGTVLAPGASVGPFQITGVLGEGGMGRVYAARDSRLGRSVAIKTSSSGFSGRFLREARAVAALNHAHICTLHDIGPDYLVMELVEGETLASLLRRARMPAETALRYGAQIAGALAAAHSKGIVHRDLKPSNIMVTKAGIKVLDFGLARIESNQGVDGGLTATRTEANLVMGTPGYMAPEQLQALGCDARTDIFALGLVLYEMIAGRHPFPGGNAAAVNAAILREEPLPLEGVSRHLAHLVECCLRKDPDQRWQSAADIRMQLELLAHGVPDSPKALAPQAAKPRWRLPAAAGVLVAALAAVTYSVVYRAPEPQPEATVAPATTYSGSEVTPSFSPDGQQVAFSWHGEDARPSNAFDIYVKQVGVGEPIRLTRDPAPDLAPKWSPDGKWIAFVRYRGDGRTGINVIPALGGLERELVASYPAFSNAGGYWGNWYENLDWTPDSKWLVIAQRATADGPVALVLLALETGEIRPLLPPSASPYAAATLAPDGRALAYWQEPGGLTVQPLTAALEPAGAPREIPLGATRPTFIPSLAWTADGRDILFSVGSRENSTVWRVPASGGSPPRQVPSLGDGAAGQAVSRRGNRMMFTRYDKESDLWSLTLDDSGQATGPPVRVFTSSKTEMNPNFSPDGSRVAFASNRSGNEEVWVCLSDGTNCSQLTNYGGPQVGTPRWSPDGSRIVFDLFQGRPSSQVVPAGGGKATQVTDGLSPRWSPDGLWIYSWCPAGTCRTPASGGTAEKVFDWPTTIEFSPDGAWLYYSRFGPSVPLMRRPMRGPGETQTVIAAIGSGQRFAVSNTGIWYTTPNTAEGCALQYYDLGTNSTRTFHRITRGCQSGLALSPDRRRVIFSQVERLQNHDLVLVEPFR